MDGMDDCLSSKMEAMALWPAKLLAFCHFSNLSLPSEVFVYLLSVVPPFMFFSAC